MFRVYGKTVRIIIENDIKVEWEPNIINEFWYYPFLSNGGDDGDNDDNQFVSYDYQYDYEYHDIKIKLLSEDSRLSIINLCDIIELPKYGIIDVFDIVSFTKVLTLSCTLFIITHIVTIDLSGWIIQTQILAGMFDNNHTLTYINLSGWDVSNVTDFDYMFYGCNMLKKIDLTGWKINKNANCDNMFNNCFELTTIISDINFNDINTNECIFEKCYKLNYNFKCLSMVINMNCPRKSIFDIKVHSFIMITDFL